MNEKLTETIASAGLFIGGILGIAGTFVLYSDLIAFYKIKKQAG